MTEDHDARMRRHRSLHATRTADTQAAFLLPHLRPGMDLLDLGCGPGTITVGLAAAVAPGTAVGIDREPRRPDEAPSGLTLVTGDVCELPFPDAGFDAIYAGTLLQHLPDPLAALREARRVARPGAVIGVVDADWGGQLSYPVDPLLERGNEIAVALREGSSPYVGRMLRGLLAEAGFVRCEGFARVGCDASAEDAARVGEFSAKGFADPASIAKV